jgi:nicotinamide-nucleotide amidase
MAAQIWAEVITVGSELVLGQLVDTNASYIARALSEIGVGLAYHTTVGDDRQRMAEVFRLALDRCSVVISTGGIGPTEDDLTREVWAEVLKRPLLFRPELWEQIQDMFRRAGFKMAPNNRRQAFTPEGAETIDNPRGTAPAFLYEAGDRIVFCVPGVPRETEPLMKEVVLPRLAAKYDLGGSVILNRVLKVYGLGESNVDAALKEIMVSSANPYVGLQASRFETKVRMTARADSPAQAFTLLDDCEARIRAEVGPFVFALDDETLAGNIARMLQDNGLSVAVVDALTNGVICSDLGLAAAPGVFRGALIVAEPSPPAELIRRGRTGREAFGADVTLAVAGWPEEEGRLKVDVHLTGPYGEVAHSQVFGRGREMAMNRGGTMALFTLYRYLRENG